MIQWLICFIQKQTAYTSKNIGIFLKQCRRGAQQRITRNYTNGSFLIFNFIKCRKKKEQSDSKQTQHSLRRLKVRQQRDQIQFVIIMRPGLFMSIIMKMGMNKCNTIFSEAMVKKVAIRVI